MHCDVRKLHVGITLMYCVVALFKFSNYVCCENLKKRIREKICRVKVRQSKQESMMANSKQLKKQGEEITKRRWTVEEARWRQTRDDGRWGNGAFRTDKGEERNQEAAWVRRGGKRRVQRGKKARMEIPAAAVRRRSCERRAGDGQRMKRWGERGRRGDGGPLSSQH